MSQTNYVELLNLDLDTLIYLRSEAEFRRARRRGFWDSLRRFVTGQTLHLRPFDEVTKGLPPLPTLELGIQTIPLNYIRGSVGRPRDFTRHFMPLRNDEQAKERWRTSYTLAVSGAGFPPVEVYQLGPFYYVQDGHHRVSVASYLGWPTLQAYVSVWPSPFGEAVDLASHLQEKIGDNGWTHPS